MLSAAARPAVGAPPDADAMTGGVVSGSPTTGWRLSGGGYRPVAGFDLVVQVQTPGEMLLTRVPAACR